MLPESLTIEQALKQAIADQQADKLQDAERLYQAILQVQPNHPDANHNLGVLAVQVKQLATALTFLKAAVEARPRHRQYWLSYIDALIQANQTDAARLSLKQARQLGLKGKRIKILGERLKAMPPSTLHLEAKYQYDGQEPQPGAMTVQQNSEKTPKTKPAKQDKSVSKSILLKKENPSSQETNILLTLFNEGQYTETAILAEKMTLNFPQYEFGWKVLGAVLNLMARPQDALEPMQKAASLSTEDFEAYSNLAATQQELGRLSEAEDCCRQALQINPDYAEAHNNLGNVLRDLARLDEAEASYRRALEIKPDYFAETHSNLGLILHELGRLDEAEENYVRAIEIEPDQAIIHYGFGNLLNDLGRLDAAASHFKRCLETDPQDALGVRLLLARIGCEPIPERASDAHLDRFYVQRSHGWDLASYRGHKLVAGTLKRLAHKSKKLDILDAGCGTGLVGVLVRGLASRLDGVDMSSVMLKTAREKGVYDSIHQGDLVSYMHNNLKRYDVITCAATLIHFGDLAPVFYAVTDSLREDGLFVFTLFPNDSKDPSQEVVVAQNSGLAKGGCFTHSPDYVSRLAKAAGFIVEQLDTEIHEYDNKTLPLKILETEL